jgi:protein TonB
VPLVAPAEVDVAPKPVTRVMPVYPAEALKKRVRGNVVLRVLVDENGEPKDIKVVQGARSDLNDAAIAAARQWRFEPATKKGWPVRTYTTVRFSFEGVQFARTPLPEPGARTPTPHL